MRWNEHCIQYAYAGDTPVQHTEKMDDREVCVKAGVGLGSPVERLNRCPVCQTWTTVNGEFRKNSSCPAVKAAKINTEKYLVSEDDWRPTEKAIRKSLNAEEEVKRLNERLKIIEHTAWSLIRCHNSNPKALKDWVEAMRLTLINKGGD